MSRSLASDDADDKLASDDTLLLGTRIDPASSPHTDAADDGVISVPDCDGTQIACDPDGEPLIAQVPDDPAGYVTDHGYVADSVVEPKDNGKAVLVIEIDNPMLPPKDNGKADEPIFPLEDWNSLEPTDVVKHRTDVRKRRVREKSKPRDDANAEKPSDHAHD